MLTSNHDAKMFTFSCFLVLLNVLFLLNKQSDSSLLPISSSSLSSIRIEIKQRNWRRIRKYERERGGGSNRPPPCGPSRPYLLPLIFFPRFSPVQFHPHTPLSLYVCVFSCVSIWLVSSSFLPVCRASGVSRKWRQGVKRSLGRREKLSFAGMKMDDDSTSRLVQDAYCLKELDM